MKNNKRQAHPKVAKTRMQQFSCGDLRLLLDCSISWTTAINTPAWSRLSDPTITHRTRWRGYGDCQIQSVGLPVQRRSAMRFNTAVTPGSSRLTALVFLLTDEFEERTSTTTRWPRREWINEVWNSDCCSEVLPSGEVCSQQTMHSTTDTNGCHWHLQNCI